jgi:hypothetical protein
VVARNCVWSQGDYLTKAPRAAGPRVTCGLGAGDVPAYLSELPALHLVLLVSTFWFYPGLRSFPEQWIPLLREEGAWRALREARVVVMADVVTAPDGHAIDLDPHNSGEPQAHGAQLMGLAAGDAVGVELPEDVAWLRAALPQQLVLPLRFATATAAPSPPAVAEAGWSGRRGLVWVGSAHEDNRKALELVALKVLPRVRQRLLREGRGLHDGRLLVVGGGTDDVAALRGREAEGLEVLGHVQELDAVLGGVKVCVSPTLYGRRRFQTKHLQALARGLPVVTTLKGAAGYRLPEIPLASPTECGRWRGGERFGEEGCGWEGVSEADCVGALGCCWSTWLRDDASNASRPQRAPTSPASSGSSASSASSASCVRRLRVPDAYAAPQGLGLVVASPGLSRPRHGEFLAPFAFASARAMTWRVGIRGQTRRRRMSGRLSSWPTRSMPSSATRSCGSARRAGRWSGCMITSSTSTSCTTCAPSSPLSTSPSPTLTPHPPASAPDTLTMAARVEAQYHSGAILQ